MKNIVLFCTGLSGSGKSYFIENKLPTGLFYKLKSATTRSMRDGEQNGREYYFVDEKYFDSQNFVTNLWVNENFWTPDKPKWLYGVPEFEVYEHMGQNFVYDVIQPKYARQMLDWFNKQGLTKYYDFKTLYFIAPDNSVNTVQKRANMPDDANVRRQNTCDPIDFLRAKLDVDFMIKSSAEEMLIPNNTRRFLLQLKHRANHNH